MANRYRGGDDDDAG